VACGAALVLPWCRRDHVCGHGIRRSVGLTTQAIANPTPGCSWSGTMYNDASHLDFAIQLDSDP
jgi:hypothetical protein